MELFATNLRALADGLGLPHAEIARRAGLSERRFGNYIAGTREPDLATLARIATVLNTTTDWLLGLSSDVDAAQGRDALLRNRLEAAAISLATDDLELAVVQVEAIIEARRKHDRST